MSDDEKITKGDHEHREGHDESDESEEREREERDSAPEADDGDAEAAHRVASALGVAEDEPKSETADEEAAAAEAVASEEAAPANRSARRAEASQRRKKRKATAAAPLEEDAEIVDETLPKDKNARAKELLKRRREQASSQESRPIQLLPGEMVDDALARSGSAISKWIRENFSVLQWVFVGAIAAGGVYLFYQSRVDKRDAGASSALMEGVTADEGRVMAEDKRTDEQKQADPTPVFKTSDERADTALAAYKKAAAAHAGTAPAVLARLGEAGDYLDKREWANALEAFSAVASSTLANADPDVKGRALEGLGFAKEGKGDLDGALGTFKELESVDARGFKELGLYHQGRIWLARGDKDKAKDFLKQAHDKLDAAGTDMQFKFLQQVTDDALRRIDPSLVPNKAAPGKGGTLTPEDIQKLQRQIADQLKQKDPH